MSWKRKMSVRLNWVRPEITIKPLFKNIFPHIPLLLTQIICWRFKYYFLNVLQFLQIKTNWDWNFNLTLFHFFHFLIIKAKTDYSPDQNVCFYKGTQMRPNQIPQQSQLLIFKTLVLGDLASNWLTSFAQAHHLNKEKITSTNSFNFTTITFLRSSTNWVTPLSPFSLLKI